MALAIATNNAALNAAASASSVNKDMETSMARLSSGKRINSASDDAAGVAISSRLSAEIRGTDQAIRNALDGQALIDTAEGAHSEIENILQRMREISVQAANDTNNDQDRANLQAEMDAMVNEIDRIAGTTTWAGENLMEAAVTDFSFQIGANVGEKNQIDIKINGMGKKALKLEGDSTDVQKTLSNVTVGSSNNTADYNPATEIRQGSISGGVVSANNGNTSITLPDLGYISVSNIPAFVAATDGSTKTMTINNTALDAGFSLTLGTGVPAVVAVAGQTVQNLADTINAGTGNVLGSGAIAADAGHGYSATVSGNVITLAAAGAITLAGGATTSATDNLSTPTLNAAKDTLTLNPKALATGFQFQLQTGVPTINAAPGGSAQDLADTINAGSGNVTSSATAADDGHGYQATVNASGNITLTAAGAITGGASGTTTSATTTAFTPTLTGGGPKNLALNSTALAEGFTLTLATGVAVTAQPGGTVADLLNAINFDTGLPAAANATSANAGHGFSAAVGANGSIDITANGPVTVATTGTPPVTAATAGTASVANISVSSVTVSAGTLVGANVSTVTASAGTLDNVSSTGPANTVTLQDVEYTTTDPATVNAAVALINQGTAQTNITATVGANGSSQEGKVVLAHNGDTAAGIGEHGSLASVTTAYDTINPLVDHAVEITPAGVLNFAPNAGTAFELTLGNVTATGQTNADLKFIIDTTADLQTAVAAINDGAGTVGSGAGTTAHGYTATIVSINGADGTIQLTAGNAATANTQISLSDIDRGAVVPNSSFNTTSTDGSLVIIPKEGDVEEHGVFTPGNLNTTGTIELTLGVTSSDTGTTVTVSGISDKGASPAADATAIANAINAGDHGYTAVAMTGPGEAGKVKINATPIAKNMDVTSNVEARKSIIAIDEAIKTVNIQRSSLGAVSNRLSHTINNLTNISSNLSAAQGGIEDADFAHETTMLAKNQILQQASTAMLAQANASKQNVLSLLQG